MTLDTGNGPDTVTNYTLLRRGKRHDYFTGALPWPQKGSTAVSLPLGTSAPVTRVSNAGAWYSYDMGTNTPTGAGALSVAAAGRVERATGVSFDPNGGLIADLSAATAATINQLRQSFQIQKLLERDARGGTRYTEIVRSHFGVVSPDARLQRPEYLGGGSSPIVVSPIAQTSGTSASGTTTPLGQLGAMGTVVAPRHGFTQSFTEHGYVLGLVSVRADLSYQQGLRRHWSRVLAMTIIFRPLPHSVSSRFLTRKFIATAVRTTLLFSATRRGGLNIVTILPKLPDSSVRLLRVRLMGGTLLRSSRHYLRLIRLLSRTLPDLAYRRGWCFGEWSAVHL